MNTLWVPGMDRMPVSGGTMNGPAELRSVVWHTSESDSTASPAAIARYVINRRSEYHIIWNPYDGRAVQLIGATSSARSLRNDGSYQTNRVGGLLVQICVVGRAVHAPLATSPLHGWDTLRSWLAGWGVPEIDARDWGRSRASWERPGHHDHKSAPGNDHTDPGRIDCGRLFPQTVTLTGDDDMIILRQGTKSPLLVHGSTTTVLDEKSAESIEDALSKGKPACRVTADVYQRMKQR